MSFTSAKIIADNESPEGIRITTFEVTYPRFIMAEVNTHRVIAKSSASSRAIPVKKRIEDVSRQPFVPLLFGKNKAGMQAGETLNGREHEQALEVWNKCLNVMLQGAAAMEKLGVHKQLANRLLEPFAYATTVLTATEWDNFLALRDHSAAQPEFQELAAMIGKLLKANVPYHNVKHHLPYVLPHEESLDIDVLQRISAARCARVSYRSLDTGLTSTPTEDTMLCTRLLESGHMSPFDHVATADQRISREPDGKLVWEDPASHRHFFGWKPYRAELEGLSPGRRLST